MKILITDDERFVRKSIKTQLLRAGIKESDILEASNGNELLEVLENTHIDIAFVDVKMPIKNGLEAISIATKTNPNTVFYILSVFADFSYAQTAMSLGVTEYFLKPLNKEDVEKALSKAHEIIQKK